MFRTLWKLLAKRRPGRPGKKQRTRSVRLSLDYLEDRITPAPMIITVMNLSDAVVPPSHGPDLRQAIAIANLPANAGSTINFAVNGTIILVQRDLTIRQPMTIDGIGHTVRIDGAQKSRIFAINTPGTVNLNHLTIKNGKTNFSEVLGGVNGGGIYDASPNSILNLNTDSILQNTAVFAGNGGGVYANGIVNIFSSSLVDGNTAGKFGGSGTGGGVYAKKNITVDFSTISNNTAMQGGGIYQAGTGTTLTVRDLSTVTINKATGYGGFSPIPGDGGGIWAMFNAVVNDSSVTHNTALTSGNGGGIYSLDGNITLTGGEGQVAFNLATGEGGGVWADFNAYLEGTSVFQNIANAGGGGVWANDGFVKLTSSTVDGNLAGAGGTGVGGASIGDGGGIWSGTNVTLDANSFVTNNTANGNGGGIFALHSVTMNGGTVSGNSTVSSLFDRSGNPTNGSGGGIWAGQDVTMNGGTVDSNTAGLDGGGIFDNGGNVDLNSQAVVSNNTAGMDGGGIWDAGGNVSIDFSTVAGNDADNNGGGIFVSGNGSLEELGSLFVFDGSVISQNQALNEGGGIYVDSIEAVTIDSTTFDGNIAGQNGGGIAAHNVVNLSITNSTFTHNEATSGCGGAVYVIGPSDVYIDSCDFGTEDGDNGADGNTAGKCGGAIYLQNVDATINNCFFDSNVAYGGPHSGSALFADTGAIVDLNNSDFDDTLGLSSTLSTDLIDTGNAMSGYGSPGEIDSSGGNSVRDNSYVYVTNFGFAGSGDIANDVTDFN